jgi:hypothetical protein
MGSLENIHQLKKQPDVYNWFVGTVIKTVSSNLPELVNASRKKDSSLVAQFDSRIHNWPTIICKIPSGKAFAKDDFFVFNILADSLDGMSISGHSIHTTDHKPGRTKFLTAEMPIYIASFCIQPLLKSFLYQ